MSGKAADQLVAEVVAMRAEAEKLNAEDFTPENDHRIDLLTGVAQFVEEWLENIVDNYASNLHSMLFKWVASVQREVWENPESEDLRVRQRVCWEAYSRLTIALRGERDSGLTGGDVGIDCALAEADRRGWLPSGGDATPKDEGVA